MITKKPEELRCMGSTISNRGCCIQLCGQRVEEMQHQDEIILKDEEFHCFEVQEACTGKLGTRESDTEVYTVAKALVHNAPSMLAERKKHANPPHSLSFGHSIHTYAVPL